MCSASMSAIEIQPTVSDAFPAFAEGFGVASHDPRALRILAKTIYRELRQSGLTEQDVMTVAGELLSHVTVEVKARRTTRDAG